MIEKREQRRAAERDRQKNEILDVALKAFAEKGYDGASMNEIASVSGYSVGHIYNVVGNKDALFEEVVSRELDELFDRLDALYRSFSHKPAVECVNTIIDETLVFFDGHHLFFQIYLNETDGVRISSTHLHDQRLRKRHREMEKKLRALFGRAIEEGAVADLTTDDLATALDELVKGFIARWAHKGYPGKISKKANVIKHILWHGIQR
jgi:AcrR family transcriptional regulator